MQRKIYTPRKTRECKMRDFCVCRNVGEGHGGLKQHVVGGVEGVDGLVGRVEDAESRVFPAVVAGYV